MTGMVSSVMGHYVVTLPDTCCQFRLKASLERLQRITQVYTDTLLSLFPQRAATLGKALGLEVERVQVDLPLHWLGHSAPEI